PIAVRVLVRVDADEELAERREAREREEQLGRTLADVARAPAAAGVLLEAARREVVDERVVCVPGKDLVEPRDLLRPRAAALRGEAERTGRRAPIGRRVGRLGLLAARRDPRPGRRGDERRREAEARLARRRR